MRLKLALQNFKSHLLMSILIVILMIFVYGIALVGVESTNFLVHANISKLKSLHHDFDMTIKGDTPLSLKGVSYYEDDGIQSIEDQYKRIASFYNIVTVVSNETNNEIINVFEGDEQDFETALALKTIPKENEAILTFDIASKMSLEIGEKIDIYVGTKNYEFTIVDVVDGEGIYSSSSVLVGGRILNDYYGIKNVRMPNFILLDLKEDNPHEILDILRENYRGYTVTNLLDKDYAKTITSNAFGITAIIVAVLFAFVLLLFINVYLNNIKKQRDILCSLGQKKYYHQILLISLIFAYVVSIIFGEIFARIIFSIYAPVFDCAKPYNPTVGGRLIAFGFIIIIPIIKYLQVKLKNNKFILKTKYYYLLAICTMIICLLLLIINDAVLKKYAIFFILLILIMLLLNVLILLFKKVKKINFKLFLYELNVKDHIYRLQIYLQIFIVLVLSILMMTIKTYTEQTKELDNMINIDYAIATSSEYLDIEEYDRIRLDASAQIENVEMSIVLGLNAEQISKYTSIELNESDREKLEREKCIILPSYYRNRYGYNVNDKVQMIIRGNAETFKILKFTDSVFIKMAVVSNSDHLYYGFVVEEGEKLALLNDFRTKSYQLINFSSRISEIVDIYNASIKAASIVMIILIVLVIAFGFYLTRLEFETRKEIIAKIKRLGLSSREWIKISITKCGFSLLIIVISSIVMSYFIMTNIDIMLRLVKSIIYCRYDAQVVAICILISVISTVCATIYTTLLYKKIT